MLCSRRCSCSQSERGRGGQTRHIERRLLTLVFWLLEPSKFTKSNQEKATVDVHGCDHVTAAAHCIFVCTCAHECILISAWALTLFILLDWAMLGP